MLYSFPPILGIVRVNSTQFSKSLASIFVFLFLSLFPIQCILYFLPKFYFAYHLPAPLTYAHNCIGLTLTVLNFLYCFSKTVLRIEGVFGSFCRSPFGACSDATLKPSQMRGGSSGGHDTCLLGVLRPLSGVLSDLLPYRLAWSLAIHN